MELAVNQKNIYFYSRAGGYVHDRLCTQIREIKLDEFTGSDQFPEGREYCPHCGRQLFIRIGCAPVTKEMPVCNRIFIKYKVNTSQICRFVMEEGMRFHAKSLSEMTIQSGEDTWMIKMDNARLELWHNNYVRISPGERYITEGFHKQRALRRNLKCLLYAETHSITEDVGLLLKTEKILCIMKDRKGRWKYMSITGYYDGTAVRVEEPLKMNQKVIIIPIENEVDIGESAAGGLHKYANPALIEQEKDAWRKATVKKHGGE